MYHIDPGFLSQFAPREAILASICDIIRLATGRCLVARLTNRRKMSQETPDSKKSIKTFALASFLNDMGSDMIYPVWPLFVTTVLKANMAALGFIDGLGEAIVSLSQAASGFLSDKLKKRKIFIWMGYFFGAASRAGYAMSSAWQHLIPFKVLDRFGKIRSAPRDAIVADISTDRDRGRNFGLLRMMDNLGAFVGILITIALVNTLGYRLLFALAAIPSLVGTVLIILKIKEPKKEGRIFKGLALREIDGNLRLYIVLNAIFALGAFSYSFLLIYAKNAGFRVAFVPVLYLIYTAAAAAFSLPFGRLSDRIGRKAVLEMAYAFWAVICLGIILGRSLPLIVVFFIFYGIHKAALEPVQKTLVTEICPKQFRASSLGAFQMIIGMCALPASALAGVLWESFGPAAPFLLSLLLTGCAGALLLFVRERKNVRGRG
jgi:MFS family permease